MPEALVRSGRWLRWVGPDGRIVDERRLESSPNQLAETLLNGLEGIPPSGVAWVKQHAAGSTVEVADRPLQEWLAHQGVASRTVSLAERRRLRDAAFRPDRGERALLLALARRRLERAMQAPEAILSALAREEERVRRVLRREINAAESWVSEGTPVLSDYARISEGLGP